MLKRTLVLWLALVSGNAALADKPPLSEEAAIQLFFDTGYTFCDARLLKEVWGLQMEYGAKVRTGRFLDLPRGRNRVARFVADQRLASGRNNTACGTWEIGLDYTQIAALEAMWGMSTIDTKTRIESEFAANRWRGIRDKIDFNGGLTQLGYQDKIGNYVDENIREFTDLDHTPFTYCDAERVAMVWGVSTQAAVTRLNEETQAHDKRHLIASIEAVRKVTPTHSCTYHPDFTYGDAELVARRWGVDIMDAKIQLGEKLTGGYATYLMHDLGYRADHTLPDVTGGTNQFFEDNHQAAFDAQGFTACDARMLARLWSVTDDEAIDRIGSKLMVPSMRSEVDLYRTDSHRLARSEEFRCAFGDSFTPEQLTTMATYWSLSEDEARERAVRKLMHGDSQAYLREALTWQ